MQKSRECEKDKPIMEEDMFMAHVTDKKIGSSIPKESKKDDSWMDKWEAVPEEEK